MTNYTHNEIEKNLFCLRSRYGNLLLTKIYTDHLKFYLNYQQMQVQTWYALLWPLFLVCYRWPLDSIKDKLSLIFDYHVRNIDWKFMSETENVWPLQWHALSLLYVLQCPKFESLLSSDNKKTLYNLAKFIYFFQISNA